MKRLGIVLCLVLLQICVISCSRKDDFSYTSFYGYYIVTDDAIFGAHQYTVVFPPAGGTVALKILYPVVSTNARERYFIPEDYFEPASLLKEYDFNIRDDKTEFKETRNFKQYEGFLQTLDITATPNKSGRKRKASFIVAINYGAYEAARINISQESL